MTIAEIIRDLGLDKLDGDPDQRAEDLKNVIDWMNDVGGTTRDHVNDIIERWEGTLPNRASRADRGLIAANAIVGGFGVEGVYDSGDEDAPIDERLGTHSGYGGGPIMEYVNTGDTYNATVLYDYEKDEAFIGTYGDWVEGWEAERHSEIIEQEGHEGIHFEGLRRTQDLPTEDPQWIAKTFGIRDPMDAQNLIDLLRFLNGEQMSPLWIGNIEERWGPIHEDDPSRWGLEAANAILGGRGVVEGEDANGFTYFFVDPDREGDTTVFYLVDHPGGTVIGTVEDLAEGRPSEGVRFTGR